MPGPLFAGSPADRLANSKNGKLSRTWKRYRPMLYLAVDSGMRPQEYLVIANADIKIDGVQVTRALERGGHRLSVPKTPAGRRFIGLSDATLDMLRHYAMHEAVTNKYDLVFPTATGHWQDTTNWCKRGFHAACWEAGLVEKVENVRGKEIERPMFRPYDLRHFYASMLIEQRKPLKRIQALMGHEDIHTTLSVYGHLIERIESAADTHRGLLSSLARNSCGESVALTT